MEQQTKNNKWIWISLIAGFFLFCVCALVTGGVFINRAGKRIQEGVKNNPAAAAEAAHKIADYDLPPGYQEQMAMDLIFYEFVMIAPQASFENNMMIMLAQFQSDIADQQQTEEQIRESFEQQYGTGNREMKLIDVKTMTIRGQETTVSTLEGTDERGNVIRQLITTFPGKNGTAMLMIMSPPEDWDQEMVDDFVKSIR